jgi:hypothetical protein
MAAIVAAGSRCERPNPLVQIPAGPGDRREVEISTYLISSAITPQFPPPRAPPPAAGTIFNQPGGSGFQANRMNSVVTPTSAAQ